MFQTKHFAPRCGMWILAFALSVLMGKGALWGQTSAEGTAGSSQQVVQADEVVLSVGDRKITAAEFEKIAAALPPQFAGALQTLGKRGFAQQFANLLTLALEGEKRDLHQSEQFQQMVAFERLVLLAQVTLNQVVGSLAVLTQEEIHSYYTSHEAEVEQAKVRGIYVPFEPEGEAGGQAGSRAGASGTEPAKEAPKLTEAQARAKAEELRNRIQAGEDMAGLARTESVHPTSSQGGDFGYVRRDQFAPQIGNTVFSLEGNQVSPPLRDRFGYFLFRVEQRRVQPLEEARTAIENNLRQQKMGEELAKLNSKYPVELNPHYFDEPQSQPQPGNLAR